MCCQDEATSALDAESEHLVQTALDTLMVSVLAHHFVPLLPFFRMPNRLITSSSETIRIRTDHKGHAGYDNTLAPSEKQTNAHLHKP